MGQTIWADPGQTQPEKTAVHHLDALLNKKHLKAVASLVLLVICILCPPHAEFHTHSVHSLWGTTLLSGGGLQRSLPA